MRKQQVILLASAALLFVVIYFFVNKNPPKQAGEVKLELPARDSALMAPVDVLAAEKEKLSSTQTTQLKALESRLNAQSVAERISAYHSLSHYWKDSLKNLPVAAYYLGEKAKLENSEKNLNFAANSLLNYLMVEHDPSKQRWIVKQTKELFERSLKINPANDSTIIGLGATYMFGNISDNPMEGIMKVRQVAERDSANTYAQMMLGLGGMKSGQFDNAVKRFEKVLQKEPDNLLAIFSIAESYERLSDKANAIKWYTIARGKVNLEQAKQDIDTRIRELKMK